VLACLLLLTASLRLWRASPSVPLHLTGDPVFHLAMIKGVIENGWYLHNDALGAPWGLDMHDFPMADHLHFAAAKGLGLLFPDAHVIFNLYYLLTFPLTAVLSLFVLRRFRVGWCAACLASLLYSFLPYHFQRLHHLHLAAYYTVPLSALVIIRVYQGHLPLFRLRPGPGQGRWHPLSAWALGAVLLCVLTGLSGLYYAFFTCFLLLVAGFACACFHRRWAPLPVAAGLVAVVSATVLLSLAPTFRYRWENGRNNQAEDSSRPPAQAEFYALKLAQMVLPVGEHRLRAAAQLRQSYASPPMPLVNENEAASLGALGAGAFLWLLGRLLVRRRRGSGRVKVMDALSGLTLAALLLGTVGGLGVLVALLVSPAIRAYNRISIFIAFFALFALAVLLDRLLRRLATSPRRRLACWAALAVLLVLGVLDQTSASFVPPYSRTRREHQVLRDFVGRIESSVPADSAVFQLPAVAFPGPGRGPHQMGPSHHLRPYLYSRQLRWSYGAMRGRNDWHEEVGQLPVAKMLPVLALADFAGVYIDRNGFADGAAALEKELSRLLAVEPLVSGDGKLAFYSLLDYRRAFRQACPEDEWQRLLRRQVYPLRCEWGDSFSTLDEADPERWRWCGKRGELVVHNQYHAPRRLALSMTLQAPAGPGRLRARGELFELDLELNGGPQVVERTVVVPPGRHVIRFTCDAPRLALPRSDRRELVFRVGAFRCREEE
jgi:phosphoglycerol transferase